MRLQIKVNPETQVIEDAKFKTFGCGSAIASSSLATEWVKGKTVAEAMAISNTDIVKELALPPVKIHCSVLAEDAIRAAIGDWKNIQQLSKTVPFREIIFCQGTLSFADIIGSIQQLPSGLVAKVHAGSSSSIVGSDSKDTSGESVSKENGYKLADPYNRRLKRLVDVFISVAGILLFPVHLFFIKKPFSFFSNCIAILFAQKTWIGYAIAEKNLPRLNNAVIACNGIPVSIHQQLPAESLQMMDYWYARDYELSGDLKLIWKMYRKLGG